MLAKPNTIGSNGDSDRVNSRFIEQTQSFQAHMTRIMIILILMSPTDQDYFASVPFILVYPINLAACWFHHLVGSQDACHHVAVGKPRVDGSFPVPLRAMRL